MLRMECGKLMKLLLLEMLLLLGLFATRVPGLSASSQGEFSRGDDSRCD